MRGVIFVGPTLHGLRRLIPLSQSVSWAPPAQRGDIYRAVRSGVDVIGIVDGYFREVPSILHKEILWAMSVGCHILGSSSMGALRASELHSFGMRGVGKIFESFRSGEITRDDEVAITHGPAELDFVPLSDALVNIRATLAAAVSAEVISVQAASDVVNDAVSTFYPERNLARLLDAYPRSGGVPLQSAERTWILGNQVDQKRTDALALVSMTCDLVSGNRRPNASVFEFQETIFFKRICDSFNKAIVRDFG